jgi:hypothetical protein
MGKLQNSAEIATEMCIRPSILAIVLNERLNSSYNHRKRSASDMSVYSNYDDRKASTKKKARADTAYPHDLRKSRAVFIPFAFPIPFSKNAPNWQ